MLDCRSTSPEIILCTLGTRGDLYPFLALASRLRSLGYLVTVLTNENWQAEVMATGAEFHPIAGEDEPQNGRDDYRFFLENTLPSFRLSFDFVSSKAGSCNPLMLIYRANMLGIECAAERFAIPNGRVILQPSAVKSFVRPPWPLSAVTEGSFGWIGRSFLVPALYRLGELASRYHRHTDAFRRAVGVRARRTLQVGPSVEDFTLMMCPDWFAMPQPDWPPNLYLVGFPFTEARAGDGVIERFVADQGPPVVFTPGSGVNDAAGFFVRAAETLASADLPGIFLSRSIPEHYRTHPRILCREFIDLGWLLPKTAAIFHHGGIGTTAQALKAGIPQLLVPDRFDQPDNAMRVARLGLGAAILSDRFSGTDWADLLRLALNSSHVRTQIATAQHLIASQDAIQNCVMIIEHFIARSFGPRAIAA